MKKARIILTCVALLAIVGGALAFKAGKFTSGFPRAYSTTNVTSSTVGTVIYTAGGLFCTTEAGQPLFINTIDESGVFDLVTYKTTTPNQVITLTALPPSPPVTITRALPLCQTVLNTWVTADN